MVGIIHLIKMSVAKKSLAIEIGVSEWIERESENQVRNRYKNKQSTFLPYGKSQVLVVISKITISLCYKQKIPYSILHFVFIQAPYFKYL